MKTWHSPHGTTWQAETYEEALEAERDALFERVGKMLDVVRAARKRADCDERTVFRTVFGSESPSYAAAQELHEALDALAALDAAPLQEKQP